ncbi:hypothetical protein CBR_g31650 [Chara braunii]|uniref:Uncharacterized protein n=1 Tax=Chara braunii TaxID=69332 RepID=A0A388LFU7_CHABU|nr:hypothetical protein CBR_g31650 [Chara braunii]|eukprot:GBG81093.1 hypothetical protein CBR_g31650 [Chara braunii]
MASIGIDLGTSFCCVGVSRRGRVEIIPFETGSRLMPSFVGFTESGREVGEAARLSSVEDPENVFYEAKRLIGREFTDDCVQRDLKQWPFKVVRGESGSAALQLGDGALAGVRHKTFAPEEIAAMLLSKMKETAEDYLSCEVESAVITVPAYFNDSQRRATRDAGRIAGLNVLRLLNEPTAAAHAYLDHKIIPVVREETSRAVSQALVLRNPASLAVGNRGSSEDGEKVLVFDLGGGTFDVAILRVCGSKCKVLVLNGDTHLGGADFDNNLVRHVFDQLATRQPGRSVGWQSDPRFQSKLKKACVLAKHVLTNHQMAYVEAGNERIPITRATFDKINGVLFRRCMDIVQKALDDAKLSASQISNVLLVGGSSRIPKIKAMLKTMFNGKQPQQCLHPDEAVAHGAAVLADILGGDKCVDRSILPVQEVTPLSLGVGLRLDRILQLIPRNTDLPAEQTQRLTTGSDWETSMCFRIYEGERPVPEENHYLGELELAGFKPREAGEAEADLHVRIDEDCIVHVSATGVKNHSEPGKRACAVITNTGPLSESAIQSMIADAESYKREDKEFLRCCQVWDQLDLRAREARKAIAGVGYPLRDSLQSLITEILDDDHAASAVRRGMGYVQQKRRELELACKSAGI